jgi:hypothetical protein
MRKRSLGRENAQLAVVAIVAVSLRVASAETADAAYLVLALFALRGRPESIQALGLSWILTMMNGGIAPEAPHATAGRYLVVGVAAISVLLRSRVLAKQARVSRPVIATLLLGGFFVGHSILFSPVQSVSILKAASWTAVVATLLSAWNALDEESRRRVEKQMVTGLFLVLAFSLPLLGTAAGYLRNGTGFQGILNHPQAFGSAMAVLAACVAGDLLGSATPSWRRSLAFAAVGSAIVLSEARTAGVALVAGVCAALGLVAVGSRFRFRVAVPALASTRVHVALIVAAAGALLAAPVLSRMVGDYLQKRSESFSAAEIYDASRGHLIRNMWSNVEEHPIQGIGFGIASQPASMVVTNDPVLGLPTGAAVEKGVMPLAVLEEVGIPGALAVLAWLAVLLRRAARRGVAWAAVWCVVLATNMGEATLFSAGGMGLLMAVFLTCASSETPGVRAYANP